MKIVGQKLICTCHHQERFIVKNHPRLGRLCDEGAKTLRASVKKEPNWEKKCWDAFSKYIRLRDADRNGICICFTCSYVNHWSKFDCGHGIPRQHKPTKFSEKNNHAQCKRCNGFQGGMREVYKQEMDKRYGAGTWDKMLLLSKVKYKKSNTDFKIMTQVYEQEFQKMKLTKLA